MFKWTHACLVAGILFSQSQISLAELRIGIAAEPYPPFASKDASGAWVGWEIDFSNALCAELQEKCELVETAWDGIIPALEAKKFDVILASMAMTAKRKDVIAFSRFYYNSSVSMIASTGTATEITPQAFTGKTIGVQTSTISASYADKHFGGASTVKAYPTLDEATADLAAGRVDAVIGETNALNAFLSGTSGTCCASLGRLPADPETLGEGVGAGLRKADEELKARVDAAIGALAATGKLKEITAKYPDLVTGIVLPE
jgi:polar amino acid transport system substrate-binding protein